MLEIDKKKILNQIFSVNNIPKKHQEPGKIPI